jgi:hypothetical protein
MALKPEDMDFVSNFSLLWQVILGAVLATAGGFAATQMERVVGKRERERNSALLFGEVLATVLLILEIAAPSRERGEPYGPFTMRMLRSARREIDIYERNRERLFDLQDGALRGRIHTAMVRVAMPLDNIFDTTSDIERARQESADGEAIASLERQRNDQFNFVIQFAARLKPIITQLEPMARQSFEGLSEIAREA